MSDDSFNDVSDEWCSMSTNTSSDRIINDIAKIAGIDDWCSMKSSLQDEDGQGHDFALNSCVITLQDNTDPEKSFPFVVKTAPEASSIVRQYFPVSRLYANECRFYNHILPAFEKFQEEKLGKIIFNTLTKCYSTDLTPTKEKIYLEYLKPQGFIKMYKRDSFDREHLDIIFKEYGKFHAISMAFKRYYFHEYRELSKDLYNYYNEITDIELVNTSMKEIMKECMTYLKEENDIQVIQTFKIFAEKPDQIFKHSMKYQGKNTVILHGDTWSNNMMYKYSDQNGDLLDIRLCNFQSSFLGTPVYDLSYCLYSGATKEVCLNLKYYLLIYYKNFSDVMRQFNCDPNIYYPFDSLVREWKEYSKFGFFLALLMMQRRIVRIPEKDTPLTLTEALEDPERARNQRYDKESVKFRALHLIRHMYVNDFLDTPITSGEENRMDDFDLDFM